MPFDLQPVLDPLIPLIAIFAAMVGLWLLVSSLASLLRARLGGFAWRVLSATVLLVAGLTGISLHGYHRLTHEAIAATLSVTPTGPQRFDATLTLPDGRTRIYRLAGDEIYIDAQIVKWKPAANLLGVHTWWSLDRIAGRYRSIEQERSAERTIHSIGDDSRWVDLAGSRQRFAWLAPLYDASYGSASFVPVSGPARLELRVSTTGLLIRDAGPVR
jgi:hypothetical protein